MAKTIPSFCSLCSHVSVRPSRAPHLQTVSVCSHCMFMVNATSSVALAHHFVPWQCPVPRPKRWRRGSACLAPRTGSPVWRAPRRASRSPRQTVGRARAAPPSARGTSHHGLWPLSCDLWRAPPARPRPPPGSGNGGDIGGFGGGRLEQPRQWRGAERRRRTLSPWECELPRAARRALSRRRRRRRARAPREVVSQSVRRCCPTAAVALSSGRPA